MTDVSLEILLRDTEAQLAEALQALGQGLAVDLSDLTPRIEEICRIAVNQKVEDTAQKLESLISRLDGIERMLREQMAAQAGGFDPKRDGKRAAELYRNTAALPDASPPDSDGKSGP